MLRPLETYEEMLQFSIKKYILQMEMGISNMAEWTLLHEVYPTMELYKQALWAEYYTDKSGIIYIYNNNRKTISILIQMGRAIKI